MGGASVTARNRVILGLGSNVGDRQGYLRRAVALLHPLLEAMQCSPVYESQALLDAGAPAEWNAPFLNMAVCGETTLAPLALLAEMQAMERSLGKIKRGHWAPREIDIDILAYADTVMADAVLVLPHPELLKRDFALVPLADIAPDWVHPLEGKAASLLVQPLRDTLKKTDITIL